MLKLSIGLDTLTLVNLTFRSSPVTSQPLPNVTGFRADTPTSVTNSSIEYIVIYS